MLLSIKSGSSSTQGELAERVGIRGPTLTHHLDNLERAGLVTRTREAHNKRVQHVELTTAGEAMFRKLREAAVAFDKRARTGLADAEIAELARLLLHLHDNVQER